MAADIQSISEFLLHAGTNYRIFDMGRGLVSMSSQAFLEVENASVPAPRPRQQHAWFGITFWQGAKATNPYIWFVKLPLDEQGLVVGASRNHFLQIIVDALQDSLSNPDQKQQELPDNPYSFVPNQTQMAQFTALAREQLALPPSSGLDIVKQYLLAPAMVDWQTLPLQGIADVALLLEHAEHATAIMRNFDNYAPTFIINLLQSLESVELDETLAQWLREKLAATPVDEEHHALINALLRALTSETVNAKTQAMLTQLLTNHHALTVDGLSVIAARHYNCLQPPVLLPFFEATAQVDERLAMQGQLFVGLFSDLVQIPSLRTEVLGMLRHTERSAALSKAIGLLFQANAQ